MVQAVWKIVWHFLIKIKMKITIRPSNCMFPRELKTYAHWTWIFIAALFLIDKPWKQLNNASVREWLNKLWYIHIIECCLTIKSNKLLIHTTICMGLKGIMLSEKKPNSKGYILYDSIFMTLSKWRHCIIEKNR